MAAYNVNGKCESCTHADAYGRSCAHGLLFPVLWMMSHGRMENCPNFQKKSLEQLEEQYRLKQNDKKGNKVKNERHRPLQWPVLPIEEHL